MGNKGIQPEHYCFFSESSFKIGAEEKVLIERAIKNRAIWESYHHMVE